ncbi:MAG TPA: ribosome biogenesis GTPase Der [Kiritimatiellia bacterium]|jgi:GTP-binding protein|nr:ribosome biogenesis GTPase Der [Kiritimatiellia bacterium]HOR97557.1 ribosome biogenesis GTPase Der [Kiritimatiellia bacterium]HPC48601.1 ribosome biogenesis GTPase Der [Kiritimatiellia bacterium]HPK36875.1 ribosome biogenesis GTPase Der [Kiritimatiellia bacterium]HPW75273.1 ribosome biogenesis GTPase Der [Kiritimatiellia bacterium]
MGSVKRERGVDGPRAMLALVWARGYGYTQRMISQDQGKARVVVIVGRPNVGKSAVFNRIAGRRIAIVHDESGVTRDRLMREVEWDDQRFTLIDTGGITLLTGQTGKNAIEAGIRAQVDAAIGDAAVALLVVDVKQGMHPLDEEVALIVRKAGIPCVVAVNKCDEPQHEAGVAEFARLGFATFPVAAQHNRGMGELMEAVLPYLPEAVNPTETQPLRVAVVGRPNAGKSSYINRLLRSDRVIVSDVAGTTRDSIDVPFTIGSGAQARHYILVDTAGMRNRHRIDNAVERFSLFRAEESIRGADVVVLMLDAEIGPTVQDKHIAAMIQKYNKGCVLLMNKWDRAMENGMTQTRSEPVLRQIMPFMGYSPVLFISAVTGFNVRKSVETIDAVAAQTRVTLPTGILNRTLVEATERVLAPARNGKRLRVYYAVQIGVAPVSIRLFVNDPKLATKPYTDFLIRSLRSRFGLEGAPVRLFYRARTRPESVERPARSRSRARGKKRKAR